MKIIKITFLLIGILSLTSCASGYQMIQPERINYVSSKQTEDVKLEYKYNLLNKKYSKKEYKKGVQLVSVKITNNSDRDLMFGRDIKLAYTNGSEIDPMEREAVFRSLKQSEASYLWYLLLTPLQLNKMDANGQVTSSTPIGLAVGPGIAGGNMIAAGSANKKFKTELMNYDLNGVLIKKGETKFGLVGIRTNSFNSLQLNISEDLVATN